MAKMPFPRRMIHLDFHTGPDILDVGQDFDAERFADVMADAHVDSVTLFAKCHHGLLYYDTDRPERHPGLARDLNLLEAQVDALHCRGIRAPLYLSVQCDEYAAATRPEWIALKPEGNQVKWGQPLGAGWKIMDMASPYQDFLAEQLDEVLRKFAPTDGIFMDMCWDQISISKYAIDGMKRMGLDPRDPDDRARHARAVTHQYMRRYRDMVEQAHKGHTPAGIWFNSRPKTQLAEEKKFLRHVEIECLPTGGWGYAYFPYAAAFVRPFGLPTLSHTGRFHTSWGDFGGLKPEAALKYECSLILSQGMTGGIGDQLHPRGKLDKAVYERIGKVYGHIEACEKWVAGGKNLTELGVLIDPAQGDRAGAVGLGIIRSLQQLRHQFDLIGPDADLGRYGLVIATTASATALNKAMKAKLKAYLKAGGALLIAGDASLDDAGKPILPELGIVPRGPSPYTTTYLRPAKAVAGGMAKLDHVMYEPQFRMTAGKGAEVLCRVVEPYFERAYDHFCSHRQTPPARLSRYAAVVQKGKVITFAAPIFAAYGKHGNLPYRQLLGNCIDRLLPEPLLRVGGPAHLETTVVRKGRATVVHLVSFCPVRRTEKLDIVEDPFPLIDVPVAARLDKPPRRALLAPAGQELEYEYRDGYAHVRVTVLDGHAMVVFE